MSKKADLLSGIDEEDQENQTLVFKVFGYGSLLWKVNFNYSSRDHGHIKGFQRKFWQNNKTHRGTEEKVLTLMASYSFQVCQMVLFLYLLVIFT